MAYNQENIIVGAADVFMAPMASTFPTYTAGQRSKAAYVAAEVSGGWKHVGLTQGGVEFAYAPEFGEVDVDQFLDVAKMFKQSQSVTVNTTFAEATLENLLFAWGQPTATLTGTGDKVLQIYGGSLGDKPEERKFAFIGPAPGTGRERVYELERVLSVESSTHSLSKTEATVIPVALRCLPAQTDTSGTVTYGEIVERTFTAA